MSKPKKTDKKIIVARHAGFCFGVRRAVEMTKKVTREKTGRVFCLGEIIHNPRVIADLEKKGMKTISDLKKVKKGNVVIIRSHGVAPEVVEEIKAKGAKVMDATCPFVKKAQKAAADFQKENRQVVIFGDPLHAEVIGIRGYAPSAIVVQNEKETKKIKKFERVGLLAQTTQKPDVFKKIIAEIKKQTKDFAVANTICLDSFQKKQEVKKMAKRADVMIVVGGKKSNNTQKLAEVAVDAGAKTYCIEDVSELKKSWFGNAKKIGLSAGASTPDESIEEVREKIESFLK